MNLMIKNLTLIFLIAGNSSVLFAEDQAQYLQLTTSKNAEENLYLPWHGMICSKNGKVEACGETKYEIGGPDKGFIVFECASDASKSLEIPVNDYKPQKLSEIQMGYLFSNCTVSGKTKVRTRYKEFENESSPLLVAVLPAEAKNIEEAASNGIELSSENSKKIIQDYEASLKDKALAKEANIKKQAIAESKRAAETKAKAEEIKKNWTTKNYLGNKVFFSKKDKLLVSSFVGMMNWNDASLNCINQKMRLPTIDEAVSLSSHGLCPAVVDNCGIAMWSATSKHNDTDAQRNMLVGNGAWGVLNEQAFPSEFKSDLGVVCVK